MSKEEVISKLIGQNKTAVKDLAKNFKYLEEHLIQVQENQVEFEKYLKKILAKLEDDPKDN